MTQKEQTESRIVYDKTKIDELTQKSDGSPAHPYSAFPYMRDLLTQMNSYIEMDGAEKDTCCMIYAYLGDEFALVPYLPHAVECYTRALSCACVSDNRTVMGEIPDLVYKTAKYRNMIARDRYMQENSAMMVHEDTEIIYDDCADVDVKGMMKPEEVRALIRHAAGTARKSLIAHPAEHTEEYAELIYDMHDTIFAAFDDKMQKSPSFPFAFWAAKKSYLANCGIAWETPASLNPSLRNPKPEE